MPGTWVYMNAEAGKRKVPKILYRTSLGRLQRCARPKVPSQGNPIIWKEKDRSDEHAPTIE